MKDVQTLRSSRLIDATPFFYGWVVLAVGTIASVMMGPSQTFTISLFVDHFVTDLDLARSTVSLLYGGATLVAALLLPLTGRLVDRYRPRFMMVLVSIGLGLAIIGMSLVRGMFSLWLGLLLLRFFGFGSMQLVSNNAIAQWFVRRRGFAMGLYNQSLSVSLVLYPWLSALLIGLLGWRSTWQILGIVALAVMVPLAWMFLRDQPELYGLEPDGGGAGRRDRVSGPVAEEDWTLAEAMNTVAFWVLAGAFATMTMIMSSLAFHQISLFKARGLELGAAVRAFQMVAVVSVFSNLAMGRFIDRVSARLLVAATLVAVAAMLLGVQRLTTPLQALGYGALVGLGGGSYRVLDSTVWPKYFGRRHLGAIKGVTLIGTLGGTALGPFPLGLSADLLGSYAPALNALVVLPLGLAAAVYFVIRRPEKA